MKMPETPEIEPSSEKEERWGAEVAAVGELKDKLGRRVDEGIKEVIVGLHVWDIHTFQSCEGHAHAERSAGAPYIDIEAPDADALKREARALQGDIVELKPEVREIVKKIEQKNIEECMKALLLLGEFYVGRNVPYDRQLGIQGKPEERGRIESQGARFQKILGKQKGEKKLQEYQEEMKDFSTFLKDKFFKQ